ncbi:hypothetical protein [Butyrivibrio sp. YAB3001]|uniref:hypothetical protein n=1 Tax=Butyrivibrio sp. YAB3001 TaxID=1520812 RepID=UPI0008F6656C|nr:hypothetical protein [Butyrivibrio sp. YAB3001]SFC53456.1 hypothetical protein SAMN02910398_02473 [Butyrivibrio sp. YAB3001]
MKKKICAIVLSGIMLSMVGCGSSNEVPAEGETSEEKEVTETAESSEEQEAAQEQTTVEESEVALAAALDPNTEYVFGTATLSYADFYSGDVSSTDSYDAVSSATSKKYEIFENMATDYVDETTNAEGYHITGVKNVNVAVPADKVEEYEKLNDSFVKADAQPAQYKIVSVENGAASYSETVLNVVDTVEDAEVELLTGSNWGDYQLNIKETSTAYLRNTREDEGFAVSGAVQGVIVETESGIKVGMEYLQSVWVQPYEISFNIEADNSHNKRVVFDNLAELSKLEKENIVSVTYINQNDAYVYKFAPTYVKPVYRDVTVTGKPDAEKVTFTLSEIPEGLENPGLTVTYIVGEGHDSVRTVIFDGALTEGETSVNLDAEAFAEATADKSQEGSYTAVITSDNYANVAVTVEE